MDLLVSMVTTSNLSQLLSLATSKNTLILVVTPSNKQEHINYGCYPWQQVSSCFHGNPIKSFPSNNYLVAGTSSSSCLWQQCSSLFPFSSYRPLLSSLTTIIPFPIGVHGHRELCL